MATTSQTSPASANGDSKQSTGKESNPQLGLKGLEGDAKGIDGKREGYLILYSDQSGQDKATVSHLNNEEQTSLDNILFKLLDCGVKLQITYTPMSEFRRQDEQIQKSFSSLNHLENYTQNHGGSQEIPLH